ncbi:hypothetical protein [Sporosarcina sp. OR05]|uniref:hypothetical protein n=1 Tax=Sporosarcina sp. OR05 TaxID=2969819 RepID=UPI00352B32B8
MINKWKVIIQYILVLIPLLGSIVLPIDLLWGIVSIKLGDLTDMKQMIYGVVSYKKLVSLGLGFILTVMVFGFLRHINKNKTFNTGSDYFDYPMRYFVLAGRRGLGYKEITLVRVPLYMQFKLLFNDVFDCMISDTHPTRTDKIKVVTLNLDNESDEINFILSDTYQIQLDDLPIEKRSLPTVLIERGTSFSGVRTYNQEFTAVVREQTNNYRLQYNRVNIFATTNTQHTKEIVLGSFKNGGRTGFNEIYVYEQNSKDYKFSKAHAIQ